MAATTPRPQLPKVDLPEAEALRRELRLSLRDARSAAGLTQRAIAQKLDWSISKVVRIEQGTVPVAPSDVRVMLNVLGVEEPRVEELVQLARRARDAKSWSEYDDIISPAFKEMIGQEPIASSIWKYEPSVVSGYFQTGSYARALLTALGHSPEDVVRRAEIRDKRQLILELDGGPDIHVVLGEIALVRPVGSAEIMREQIKYLIEVSKRPNVDLTLLPIAAGAHLGMGSGPFTVIQSARPNLDDSLYLEDAKKATTAREDAKEISSHLDLFNALKELAEKSGDFESHAERILSAVYGG